MRFSKDKKRFKRTVGRVSKRNFAKPTQRGGTRL